VQMAGRGWYRAHPPQKVSTLASQKAASRKSAVGEWLESDSACAGILLLFSLSLFRGGVFKAREMSRLALFFIPLAHDLSISSLSPFRFRSLYKLNLDVGDSPR